MEKMLKLKVDKKVYETENAVSLYFKPPALNKLRYESGQFLTLFFSIDGEELYRSYSLNTAYAVEDEISVTIKRVPGGRVSNYIIDNVHEGDKVSIVPPRGTFTVTPIQKGKRNIVLIGGGSGITPLISIAKKILYFEQQSNVTLLYANKDLDSIIFYKNLEELIKLFPGRFKVTHYLENPPANWSGETGRISRSRLSQALNGLQNEENSYYFICGPGGLMIEAKEGLALLDIPEERISIENFGKSSELLTPTSTPKKTYLAKDIKVIVKDKEYDLSVPANTSILDAALDKGVKIPFSCCSGTCATCLGKVMKGKVEMSKQLALSKSEIEKGYVLSCVSHPVSDDVVIKIE